MRAKAPRKANPNILPFRMAMFYLLGRTAANSQTNIAPPLESCQ
jgi:hypothetical protein